MPSGPSGEADVGGAEHLTGEAAEGLADLGAEHRAAGLAEHAHQRAGHRLRLGGQRVAHRGHDVLGDRLDEPLPHADGLLDPLGAAPGRRRCVTPDGNSVAESSQWSASRSASATALRWRSVGDGSGCLGHGAAGDVLGEGPVHRALVRRHHRLHLAHQRGEVGHPARPARRHARTAGSPEGSEDLLERRALEGVVVRRRRGRSPGSFVMGPTYSLRQPGAARSTRLRV